MGKAVNIVTFVDIKERSSNYEMEGTCITIAKIVNYSAFDNHSLALKDLL